MKIDVLLSATTQWSYISRSEKLKLFFYCEEQSFSIFRNFIAFSSAKELWKMGVLGYFYRSPRVTVVLNFTFEDNKVYFSSQEKMVQQAYHFYALGSRCGSVVKWWTDKINEIKRSRVRSPARPGQPLKKIIFMHLHQWPLPVGNLGDFKSTFVAWIKYYRQRKQTLRGKIRTCQQYMHIWRQSHDFKINNNNNRAFLK
jgi:hypothetical protein